jgi:hypothetical protein
MEDQGTEKVEPTPPEEERIDPFELFSEQLRIPVRGLTYIGHIQRDISFCGHTFTLKTLRPSEKAAVALAVQPWRDTIAEPEVWAHALVGLALVAIDGDDTFCPPAGPDLTKFARARLNHLTDSEHGWYPPTLAHLYSQYLALETEALAAVEELRNLSEGNRGQSLPSPDSSIPQGILDALNNLDSPPSTTSS